MDRRTFLVATGAAAAAGTATSARAAGRERDAYDVQPRPDARVLEARLSPLFTAPYFRDLAERFGRRLLEISDGRIQLAFTAAVASGDARGDVWFGSADERSGDDPALAYFAGLPGDLGLPAELHRTWLMAGGGQILWDDVAGDAGFKPLMIGHTDTMAGGWAAHDFATVADFHNAPVAVSGLAARLAQGLGARTLPVVASVPGPAMATGTLAYAEPLLPFAVAAADGLADHGAIWMRDGLRPYGAVLLAAVDTTVWHSLAPADKAAFSACAALSDSDNAASQRAHHALVAPHIKAARRIRAAGFPDAIAAAVRHVARDLVADLAAQDASAGRVHEATMAFRTATTGLPDPRAGVRSCA
jgi:TRAP-type mannitol/chloroaromatic compound transport system substrate-binding protein